MRVIVHSSTESRLYLGGEGILADRMNAMYPEGTVCRVWIGFKEGEGKEAKVYQWGTLGGHTFGAWFRPGGFVAITHIEVPYIHENL